MVVASRTEVEPLTSCRLSLSPVAIRHWAPSRWHWADKVPRMSSASQPSQETVR